MGRLQRRALLRALRVGARERDSLLELGASRKLDAFDVEWYEGLFLRRLRHRLFAMPGYDAAYRESFDTVANTYQYDWVDLEAVMVMGKRRYYAHLIGTVKEIVVEAGASGEIARVALKAYRFSHRAWETA